MKLYHYTSIDSLAMIMSSRSIKFNRLDKVDDLEPSALPHLFGGIGIEE